VPVASLGDALLRYILKERERERNREREEEENNNKKI
jgi:hypothetical protein